MKFTYLVFSFVILSTLAACDTTKPLKLASEAAENEKNLTVEATRIPLKDLTTIEVFIFTDRGKRGAEPPNYREGYKIRISLDE